MTAPASAPVRTVSRIAPSGVPVDLTLPAAFGDVTWYANARFAGPCTAASVVGRPTPPRVRYASGQRGRVVAVLDADERGAATSPAAPPAAAPATASGRGADRSPLGGLLGAAWR